MTTPHFNGSDYDPALDWARLDSQLGRVFRCMEDGNWRSLDAISRITGDPHASVSAQLRHLRKERFGSHTVDRRRSGDPSRGLWVYKLTVNPWAEQGAADD